MTTGFRVPIIGGGKPEELAFRRLTVNNDSVTVDFEDGSHASGNMVIGADGSYSKISGFLVGPEAAKGEGLGLTMINQGAGGYSPEQAHILRSHHPIVHLPIHPTQSMSTLLAALDIPDQHDTTDWKFQNYAAWWGPPFAADLKDPAARLKHVKDKMSHFPEPFRTGWLPLSDDVVLPVYPGQQRSPTVAWDNYGGKMTLAGDAAHSMLPLSGKQSLEDVVTAHEAEMRPRGAREVALFLEQAEHSRDWDRFRNSPIFNIGLDRTKNSWLSRCSET